MEQSHAAQVVDYPGLHVSDDHVVDPAGFFLFKIVVVIAEIEIVQRVLDKVRADAGWAAAAAAAG